MRLFPVYSQIGKTFIGKAPGQSFDSANSFIFAK